MELRLTDDQWTALQEYVQAGDRGRCERLIDAIRLEYETRRRAEIEEAKRLQLRNRWLPDFA